MTQPTPEQIEIDALRTQNAELLAEAKTAKANAKQLSVDLEAVTAERDQAHAQVRDLTIGAPVRQMLDRISVAPDVLQLMLDKQGYTFAHEDGRVVVRDKDGNVPKLWPRGSGAKGDARDVTFTADDLVGLLCEDWIAWEDRSETAKSFAAVIKAPHIEGGGAAHSRPTGAPASSQQPLAAPAQPGFGIR